MRELSPETARRIADIETEMRKLAGRNIESPMLLTHYKRELFGQVQNSGVNTDWPSFEAAYELAAKNPIVDIDTKAVDTAESPSETSTEGAPAGEAETGTDSAGEAENDASEAPRKRRGKVV